MTHEPKKSDLAEVAMKPTNKAGLNTAAEPVERRAGTKGNVDQQSTHRAEIRDRVSQALGRVCQAEKERKKERFSALLHHVDVDLLRLSFYEIKRQAAPGVDGVTWQDYEADLENNLLDLHARVHRGAYRAQPSGRKDILKWDGRQRPVGIASVEDKILQRAIVTVLNSIYEEDFLGFSYGFRPKRSQHDALDAMIVGIERKKVNWILDVDVRDFFGTVNHEWLVRFLKHRIGDERILRLIRKWLKAGVLEEGIVTESEQGTPQGATISPLMANAYLHYGAPGQTWCFQRVKFPPRQEVQPPHRESSLGSEEVTNRTKRRQSDARAVPKVKQISLAKSLSPGQQHRNGWQAPVGAPQMARWPETAAGAKGTARTATEASKDPGEPMPSPFTALGPR